MGMRAWVYKFDGIWLTGYGVVVAETIASAEEMVKDIPGVEIKDEVYLTTAGAVEIWNGDY